MSFRTCFLLVCVLAAIFDVTYSAVISCPAADDISPCVCSHNQGVIDIECIGLTQDDYQRLTAKIPQVVNINKLTIKPQEKINITKGIAKFRIKELTLDGPVDGDLSTVLKNSAFDLRKLTIKSSELTSFPFSLLPEMTMLERLVLDNCPKMTYLEKLVSCSLKYFSAMNGGLTSIPTGVIDGTPSLLEFIVTGNNIPEIKSNTFGLNCDLADISVASSNLKSVATGAFYSVADGCVASLVNLHLQHNYGLELQPQSIPITMTTKGLSFVGSYGITFQPETFFLLYANPLKNWIHIDLQSSGISNVSEDVFGAVIPYIRNGGLGLQYNGIDCESCDVKWILSDETVKAKVAGGTQCTGGRVLHNLTVLDINHCFP